MEFTVGILRDRRRQRAGLRLPFETRPPAPASSPFGLRPCRSVPTGSIDSLAPASSPFGLRLCRSVPTGSIQLSAFSFQLSAFRRHSSLPHNASRIFSSLPRSEPLERPRHAPLPPLLSERRRGGECQMCIHAPLPRALFSLPSRRETGKTAVVIPHFPERPAGGGWIIRNYSVFKCGIIPPNTR